MLTSILNACADATSRRFGRRFGRAECWVHTLIKPTTHSDTKRVTDSDRKLARGSDAGADERFSSSLVSALMRLPRSVTAWRGR